MSYIGGGLLEAGMEVDGSDLQRVADHYPGELNRSIRKAQLDDRATTPDTAFFSTLPAKGVWLSVDVAG